MANAVWRGPVWTPRRLAEEDRETSHHSRFRGANGDGATGSPFAERLLSQAPYCQVTFSGSQCSLPCDRGRQRSQWRWAACSHPSMEPGAPTCHSTTSPQLNGNIPTAQRNTLKYYAYPVHNKLAAHVFPPQVEWAVFHQAIMKRSKRHLISAQTPWITKSINETSSRAGTPSNSTVMAIDSAQAHRRCKAKQHIKNIPSPPYRKTKP